MTTRGRLLRGYGTASSRWNSEASSSRPVYQQIRILRVSEQKTRLVWDRYGAHRLRLEGECDPETNTSRRSKTIILVYSTGDDISALGFLEERDYLHRLHNPASSNDHEQLDKEKRLVDDNVERILPRNFVDMFKSQVSSLIYCHWWIFLNIMKFRLSFVFVVFT